MEFATGSASVRSPLAAKLLPYGRAAASVTLISGINGSIALLLPRYEPAYLMAAGIAAIGCFEPLLATILAAGAIALIQAFVLGGSALSPAMLASAALVVAALAALGRRIVRRSPSHAVEAVVLLPGSLPPRFETSGPAPPIVIEDDDEEDDRPAAQSARGAQFERPAYAFESETAQRNASAEWTAEREQIEKQLQTALTSISRLTEELTEARGEIHRKIEAAERFRVVSASAEDELRGEVERFKQERVAAELAAAEKIRQVGEQADKSRQDSTTALDRAEQRRRAIAGEAERLRDETVRLRDESGRLREALSRAESAAEQRVQEALRHRDSAAKVSTAVEKLSGEEQRLRGEGATLTAALDRARADAAAAERAFVAERTSAQTATAERESQLRHDLAELTTAVERARRQQAAAEKAFETERASHATQSSQRELQLKAELVKLTAALNRAREEAAASQKGLAEARDGAASSSSHRQTRLEQQLHESEPPAKESQRQLELLRAQNEEQARAATSERSLREEREAAWTAKMERLLLDHRRELAEREAQAREASERARAAEQQVAHRSSQPASSGKTSAEWQGRLAEAEKAWKQKEESLALQHETLRHEASQARALADSLTNEMRLLAQSLSEQKREIDAADSARKSAERQLEEAREALQTLRAERESTVRDRGGLDLTLRTTTAELTAANAMLNRISAERKREQEEAATARATLEDDLRRAGDALAVATENVEQMKLLEAQLTDDLSSAAKQSEELRIRMSQAQEEQGSRLQRVQKQMDEQRMAHETEIEQWKKRFGAVRLAFDRETGSLKARLAEVEKDLTQRQRLELENKEKAAAEEAERKRRDEERRAEVESEEERKARVDILQFAEEANQILFGKTSGGSIALPPELAVIPDAPVSLPPSFEVTAPMRALTDEASGQQSASGTATEKHTYRIFCYHCGVRMNAFDLPWCDCLAAVPTLRCSSCNRCFCQAGEAYSKPFWESAPSELLRHRAGVVLDREAADPFPDESLPLVLYVDGNAALRSASKTTLGKMGYHVLTASDGLEGLRLAIKHRPHVVITDAGTARVDGLELCRMVKTTSETKGTPVLLVTNGSDPLPPGSDTEKFRPDDRLRKPVDYELLKATIGRLL
jgi:CheY-like chemotaxis protein